MKDVIKNKRINIKLEDSAGLLMSGKSEVVKRLIEKSKIEKWCKDSLWLEVEEMAQIIAFFSTSE